MHFYLYSLNALFMIVMPLALGWFINRRRHAGWRLFAFRMGRLTEMIPADQQPLLNQALESW